MRHSKMAEWMENVEKAIARIMADKVYTSAEFKRERDNFHALCKDLERAEVKKWLAQILEILMAERAKDQKAKEGALLDGLIKKHEELIPTVMKTQVMVDLYWKCYAYGDELKPHIESLTASCSPPPATLHHHAWRTSTSSLRGKRSPWSSLRLSALWLRISSTKAKRSWRTLTSQSSWRATFPVSSLAGTTQR